MEEKKIENFTPLLAAASLTERVDTTNGTGHA